MHSLTRLEKVSALIVVKIKTRTPFRGEGRARVIQKASRLLVYYQETKKEKSLAIIRQNTTAAILVLHGVTWRKGVSVCLALCAVPIFFDKLVAVHGWMLLLSVFAVTLTLTLLMCSGCCCVPCSVSFDCFEKKHIPLFCCSSEFEQVKSDIYDDKLVQGNKIIMTLGKYGARIFAAILFSTTKMFVAEIEVMKTRRNYERNSFMNIYLQSYRSHISVRCKKKKEKKNAIYICTASWSIETKQKGQVLLLIVHTSTAILW